eukprot:11172792-Lingulodinium_polyedra.AAC.1
MNGHGSSCWLPAEQQETCWLVTGNGSWTELSGPCLLRSGSDGVTAIPVQRDNGVFWVDLEPKADQDERGATGLVAPLAADD